MSGMHLDPGFHHPHLESTFCIIIYSGIVCFLYSIFTDDKTPLFKMVHVNGDNRSLHEYGWWTGESG